jgi:hypothetical protein
LVFPGVRKVLQFRHLVFCSVAGSLLQCVPMKRVFILALSFVLLLATPASASTCALLMQIPALCGLGPAPAEAAPVPECQHAGTPAQEKTTVQALPGNCCVITSGPQSEAELSPSKSKSPAKSVVAKHAAASPAQLPSSCGTACTPESECPLHDRQALLCVFLS